mmetsp:Transcript_66738/g.107469  ORF Transcript_66738/g.107469 Transcript_66738/m.107469 type:complete len:86 (+) Transcript_66738:358-615(+)
MPAILLMLSASVSFVSSSLDCDRPAHEAGDRGLDDDEDEGDHDNLLPPWMTSLLGNDNLPTHGVTSLLGRFSCQGTKPLGLLGVR